MTDILPHEALTAPSRSPLDPLRQVSVEIVHWSGAAAQVAEDELAAEEPLELQLAGGVASARAVASATVPPGTGGVPLVSRPAGAGGVPPVSQPAGAGPWPSLAVIMRTPGHDEELAAGFLYSEGLIRHPHELLGFAPGRDPDGLPSDNVLVVRTAPGVDLQRRVQEEGYSRQFAVNASCGVCGKNSVAAACATLPPLPDGPLRLTPATLCALPDQLRAGQQVFTSTGGLHAAALFDASGALLALREDVGRHNAVDKLVGRALLNDHLPLSERGLLVSGRLSFEIVLKALAAAIPLIAAVSAPSSLAVDLALAGNITLVGFLRGQSFNVYTHPWRVGP